MKGLFLALTLTFCTVTRPDIAHARQERMSNDWYLPVAASIGGFVSAIVMMVIVDNFQRNQRRNRRNDRILKGNESRSRGEMTFDKGKLVRLAFVRNPKLFLLDERLFRFSQQEPLLFGVSK